MDKLQMEDITLRLYHMAKAEGMEETASALIWTLEHMEVWDTTQDWLIQIWDNLIHKV